MSQTLRVPRERALSPPRRILSHLKFRPSLVSGASLKRFLATTDSSILRRTDPLNYYFGPILLESIGKDYLDQLSGIVEVAVTQRPSIQDYRLELSYEPNAYSFESKSTQPSPQNPLPPQAPPKPSFWSFVKKLFGYL